MCGCCVGASKQVHMGDQKGYSAHMGTVPYVVTWLSFCICAWHGCDARYLRAHTIIPIRAA
jgi:hypothetical protein